MNFRHEGGALFVTRQDEFDRRILERHHEVGILFAGHTEDLRHTFGLQAFYEQIGCLHINPPSQRHPSLWRRSVRMTRRFRGVSFDVENDSLFEADDC
jgi:hypothetical protein